VVVQKKQERKIKIIRIEGLYMAPNGRGFAQLGYLLLCPTPPGCKLWNEMQKLENNLS
jgi:hypothetical protein